MPASHDPQPTEHQPPSSTRAPIAPCTKAPYVKDASLAGSLTGGAVLEVIQQH